MGDRYTTPQLHDEGEEFWELKIHVSCGTIYVDGYVNADITGLHPYEDPGLVERNRVPIRDYWANKWEKELHVEGPPKREEIAIDLLAHPIELPYRDAAQKIIAIQCFEHFTLQDAQKALLNWWNVLVPDGILIVSVPDPIEMGRLLEFDALAVRQWAVKNLVGDGFNAYALHHWAYTRENLMDLLKNTGFDRIEDLPSIHFYPSIVLKARKSDLKQPGRAYQKLPDLSKCKNILDIGPGQFPLAQATHFLDTERPDSLPEGANFKHCDLNSEKIPYQDQLFDFVYCSHVLEHMERPREVLDEIMRVGKAGYIEVPSMCLDFMMKFGHVHPTWLCWQVGERKLLFIEKSKDQNQLFLDFERTWGTFFHNAIHGSDISAPQRAIRAFFWQNQHLLNIGASFTQKEPILLEEIRQE